MNFGDRGASHSSPLQSQLINQLPRGNGGRILEDTSRAGRRRLRFPTFGAKTLHPLANIRLARRLSAQHGLNGQMIFKQRTSTILDVQLGRRAFVELSPIVEKPNALHNVKHPRSHSPRIHSQRAPQSSGNPLQKLQPGQASATRRRGNRLQTSARAANHALPLNLQFGESRLRQRKHHSVNAAVADE